MASEWIDNAKPHWPTLVNNYLKRWHKNPVTRKSYRVTLSKWRKYLRKYQHDLNPISGDYRALRDALEAWAFSCTLKASSVRTKLSHINSFYAYIVREDLGMVRNPAAKITVWEMEPSQPVEFPTSGLADRLQKCLEKDAASGRLIDKRSILIFRMLREGGFRVSELCNLRLKDFEAESSRVIIRNGKGGKYRVTAILQESGELIGALAAEFSLEDEDYIFMKSQYYKWTFVERAKAKVKPLSADAVQGMLRDQSRKHGFSDKEVKLLRFPHGLRHLWAVEHFKNGTSEMAVMLMGGWESNTMFKRYIGEATVEIAAVRR